VRRISLDWPTRSVRPRRRWNGTISGWQASSMLRTSARRGVPDDRVEQHPARSRTALPRRNDDVEYNREVDPVGQDPRKAHQTPRCRR
jgi:hypothetical protein